MITTAEKNAVREKFPNLHIVRTMKNRSKRHRYYMVEEPQAMRLIKSLRGQTRTPEKRKGV